MAEPPPPIEASAARGAGEYRYGGSELELFARAKRWKRYLATILAPHLAGHVLEVGAGSGATTRALSSARLVTRWTALEPDRELWGQLAVVCDQLGRANGRPVAARCDALAELPEAERFDAVVYIDVLEHIADDAGELVSAARRLNPAGRLVVLAPAHASLYSEFDRHVGHHRRYDKRSLRAVAPPGLELVVLRYLDSVGAMASLANRLFLRAELPSARQIWVWDSLLVPLSRIADRATFGRLGKSVLAVWRAR